ncbi:hypothetical protein C0Z17_28755 [Trinickia caryophylli]|nr:hypothetical protein C0Z17_28755 [Trinickia caryophylli]
MLWIDTDPLGEAQKRRSLLASCFEVPLSLLDLMGQFGIPLRETGGPLRFVTGKRGFILLPRQSVLVGLLSLLLSKRMLKRCRNTLRPSRRIAPRPNRAMSHRAASDGLA